MSLPTSLTNSSAQFPFFCSPSSLIFYLDDSSSFSQVLTLYNPYEFPVRYKILSTAPQKYAIGDPQGEIKAQHSIDTIVRLLDTSSSSSNQNVEHRLRIQFFDRRKHQEVIGKKDVICNILSHKTNEQNPEEIVNTTARLNRIRMNTTTTTNSINNQPASEPRDPLVIFILSVLGLLCAVILILPTIPEPENTNKTSIPSYLHMTTNSKIIASYVLGLLTVYFIRR